MSGYTLTVPEDIYARACQIAEATSQPVDQVMIDHLRTLSIPQPTLPPEDRAELNALKNLSDDALRTIAREQMPDDLQARMQVLMDKNTFGTITSDEYAELENLVERGQQLMIRKAQAAVLLVQRGYAVTAKDMTVGE